MTDMFSSFYGFFLYLFIHFCPFGQQKQTQRVGKPHRLRFFVGFFFNWLDVHNKAAAAPEVALWSMRQRAELHLMKLSGLCLPCGLLHLATWSTSSLLMFTLNNS